MKLRNILFVASALPSLIYGIGLDFSSLKPSIPEIQIDTFNGTEEAIVVPKKDKRFYLKQKRSVNKYKCKRIALDYLEENFPGFEFSVTSVIETDGFYTTTVNLEQAYNGIKINNAYANVNIDTRTGMVENSIVSIWKSENFIYNRKDKSSEKNKRSALKENEEKNGVVNDLNTSSWEKTSTFDEEDILNEKKNISTLKESLIGLNDAFNLLKNHSKDEWNNMKITKTDDNQYRIKNVPFSPNDDVIARSLLTVKKDEDKVFGINVWEFTFIYNEVYNVVSYDFKNKKPINGIENRKNMTSYSKNAYYTYPFSKYKEYEPELKYFDDKSLHYSPNGWHRLNENIDSYVTIGNNIKAQDILTKDTFSGGENHVFNGDNCKGQPKQCKFNKNITLTSMFYFGNMLHDIYYNLGFDEKKGNFQENNFGKGGKGNDSMYLNVRFSECTKEQKKKC